MDTPEAHLPFWWTLINALATPESNERLEELEAEQAAENVRILADETERRIASTRFTGRTTDDPEDWRISAY